jgi:NAD(P)-dependent dehydrogenase (short-subunit alcohol dehydrogenase family)
MRERKMRPIVLLITQRRDVCEELAPRKIRVNAIAPGHTETKGNIAAKTFDCGAGAVLPSRHRSACSVT